LRPPLFLQLIHSLHFFIAVIIHHFCYFCSALDMLVATMLVNWKVNDFSCMSIFVFLWIRMTSFPNLLILGLCVNSSIFSHFMDAVRSEVVCGLCKELARDKRQMVQQVSFHLWWLQWLHHRLLFVCVIV
jgi:hypothetical protein